MIAKKYTIVSSIGNGTFGKVYRGMNVKTGEIVAIKLETTHQPIRLLKHESMMLHYLYGKKCKCVPPVYWYGEWTTSMMGLIMPLFEFSLEQYCKQSSFQKSTSTSSLDIFVHCLRAYESIHSTGVVHRDVKPQNIMYKNGSWVIIDFGLSTFYVDDHYVHIPLKLTPHVHLIGTPKYVSWNTHQGYDCTRRDDLVSLGYVGLYLVFGERMWEYMQPSSFNQNIHDPSIEVTHIHSANNERLSACKSLPNIEKYLRDEYPSLYRYMEYVYSLDFQQTPDYVYLCTAIGVSN